MSLSKNLKKYSNFLFFGVLISCAIFLRFYKLEQFATFLSDQGRDAIIIRQITTFTHFTAIGAPSSVGQIYLGPFYYYLIAPFLPLFSYNPVGLAYGVAILSIVGLITLFAIVKKEFNNSVALLFLLFATFSFSGIEASRFSWNPNLLPFFSFLTLYFFFQFIRTKKTVFSLLFGAFFSFTFQLHHLASFLIFPMILFYVLECVKYKNKKEFIGKGIVSILSFILFSSPLIIFDLRHNFLNFHNFVKMFTEQTVTGSALYHVRLIETIQSLFSNIFKFNLTNSISSILFMLFIIISFISLRKKNTFALINLIHILTYLLAFSVLKSARHAHYYHPIYMSFFVILAYWLIHNLQKIQKHIRIMTIILICFLYIALNSQYYYFLFQKPNNQIKHAEKVANFLSEKTQNQPFNIATWPVEFFEDQYVYFLNLKNIYPANRSKLQITNQMFVLCNKKPCQIINSPSWNISMFGKAKIDTIWEIDGITIYRLIHDKSI